MANQSQELITPLVLTPRPRKNESLKGYILRVSVANGYNTPTIMLNAAGMNTNEIGSIIPPLKKLAPLLNTSVAELTKLGYRKPIGMASSKHIWINNHQLSTYYLNIKSPKICPECIQEKGFIESFWDLKFAIACPKHGQFLLKSCPSCNKRLSWNRPGLLTCKCGFDLSQQNGGQMNNLPVLGLQSFMRNQLIRDVQDFKLLEKKLGFPVEHLRTLTLGELLTFITKLENISVNLRSSNVLNWDESLLSKASHGLKDWPAGLYDCFGSFNREGDSLEGFGLRKQFESFCGSLFKSNIPKEKMAFLKNALIDFGNHHWKKGYVFNGHNIPRKVVGICGLAKAMGVMPSTAKNLVNRGLITGKTSQLNGRTRQFFDINHDLPLKPASGKTFTLRNAANWLGLPTSVLKILRNQGEFVVKHIAKPYSAYHEIDLIVLRDKLLKDCPTTINTVSDDYTTLKKVMQMKTGSPQIKANVIKAILNTQLKPLGNVDGSIAGMVFTKDIIKKIVDENRSSIFGYCTVMKASKQLHCDPLVIKRLSQDGLLIGVTKPSGLFISEESIKSFSKRYVSCAYIATKYKTNSDKIVSQCALENFDVTWLPRHNKNMPQPFVDRILAITKWDLEDNSSARKISVIK